MREFRNTIFLGVLGLKELISHLRKYINVLNFYNDDEILNEISDNHDFSKLFLL